MGAVPFYVGRKLTVNDFDQIPESSDRSGIGVIKYYWWRREQALGPLSVVASRFGACSESLKRHVTHCSKHPNDKHAKARRDELARLHARLKPRFTRASDELRCADEEYREKMLELAGIPRWYRTGFSSTSFEDGRITYSYAPQAKVNIIAPDGTVMVLFGEQLPDGSTAGCWILYANGALHRERTPARFHYFAGSSH